MRRALTMALAALALAGCDDPAGTGGDEWVALASWSGTESSAKTTEVVSPESTEWRVIWTAGPSSAGPTLGGLSITIHSASGQIVDVVSSGPNTADTSYIHQRGGHYLEIRPTFVNWTVQVQHQE